MRSYRAEKERKFIMKKFVKLTALVLALLTIFSVFSVSGFAAATELEAGSSKETATNVPEFGVEYVSSLSKAGEVDWFKFTTLSEDAYYTFILKNYSMPYYDYGEVGNSSIAPNIYIYDTYLKQLTYSYNNSTRNLKLEPDTVYYIKILNGDGNSTGNYSVMIEYRHDLVPNEKSNAYQLQLNKSSVNTFDGWGDVDWFRFTTTVAGDYIIKLKNHDLNGYKDNYPYGNDALSPNIFVYDKYDAALKETNNNVSFTLSLEANTVYYIKMVMGSAYSKQTGTYELSVTSPDYTDKLLTSISVSSMPSKTMYTAGESFDASGMVVKAMYSDGTSAIVTDYILSGFDSSAEGTNTVTVSYTENGINKTCTFDITVEAEENDEKSFSIFSIFVMIIELFMGMVNVIADLIAIL